MDWRRILFVVDSPGGVTRALVEKIGGLARSLGAEVEVFDAVFDPTALDSEQAQQVIERRRAELDVIAELLRNESVLASACVRWAYPPRDGVFKQIGRGNADLLIIQTRQHGRLARFLFTYSDYKLIEAAPCAVLVMKNDRAYEGGRVIAAVDPGRSHAKPAALDECIVEVGADLADALKLPLHLFHASSAWPKGEPHPKRLRDLPAGVIEDVAGACQARAESRVMLLAQATNIHADRVHVEIGSAVALLPAFVLKGGRDILVMGAVSRSRIRRALIGHTAEKVLEETDCDIVIVKVLRDEDASPLAE